VTLWNDKGISLKSHKRNFLSPGRKISIFCLFLGSRLLNKNNNKKGRKFVDIFER